jgi:hypothetical protein
MKANQSSAAGEGNSSVSENLSSADLINQLMGGISQEESTEEQSEEVAEEVEEAETEQSEEVEIESGETNEEEAEEESENEEIDFDSLSPEQLQAAAKKAKSRLLQDLGKLRAENRNLQAKLEENGAKPQSVKTIPTEQNPFGQLKTIEEIQAKHEKSEELLEETDRILEEHEDFGLDDIIEFGGKQFTKRQVRQANRNARDAIAKYLPAQAAHLQTLRNYEVANEQWQEMAKDEVPEIADENSEIGKAYNLLVSDPLVTELKEKLPHLGVQIEYLLAHAARSKFGKVATVKTGAGLKLKVKPPASPVGAGASRAGQTGNSKFAEAMKKFERTGRTEDWLAAQNYR